jgi:cyclic pyranopterin phosphate synthase
MDTFDDGLLVLTENWSKPDSWGNKTYKRISMTNLKLLEINFRGWFCPIETQIICINPDGSIMSGVCGNFTHTGRSAPWWGLEKLKEGTGENFKFECVFKQNSCSCDSDLYVSKALNKHTYEWFLNNKPYQIESNGHVPLEHYSSLPEVTEEDKIIAITSKGADLQEVHFHIGKRCNFNCSYCPPNDVHDNHSADIPIDIFKRILGLIEPLIIKNSPNRLFITGGEPTLNPELLDMVKYINEHLNYKEIIINTNGTATLDRMKTLLQYNVLLYISLHPEFTKKSLINKIAKLLINAEELEIADRILIKVMGDEVNEFSQLVRSIIPNQFDVLYYPIYGVDLSSKKFSNITTKTYVEMKDHATDPNYIKWWKPFEAPWEKNEKI